MISITKFLIGFLESIIELILEGTFGCLKGFIYKEPVTEYTAEFGREEDQLQKEGGGFRIGYKFGNSLIDSNSHLICLGGSGSKKSSCICFNTLLQSHESSYVVFDCSHELFNGTATFKHNNGYDVYMEIANQLSS